jgi:hypothetical protein
MDFEVSRADLRRHRVVDRPAPEPAAGQVLLHVDHAALTANNITYGAFGDLMGYWGFFPTEDGWGRVPVWGFADVVASRADGIVEGERIFGYLPMSTHLLVEPAGIRASRFVDQSPHRASLPSIYNEYQRITDRRERHDEQIYAVMRPLFLTSILLDQWLGSVDTFGARSVIIASASSKTALALAFLLSTDRDVEVIGLTSARNADFVSKVGYYDRTVVYGEVGQLDASVPTVLVDMGGDAAVLAEVHGHFADSLRHSSQVGATHWDQVRLGVELPGPAPELFFAPSRGWEEPGFHERVTAAWDAFTTSANGWIELIEHRGPDAVANAYEAVLDGQVPPHQAYTISLEP